MARGVWVYSPQSRKGGKATAEDKIRIEAFFQPLIDKFKSEIPPPPEDKDRNYVTDVYSKWYRNFFYIYEKLKIMGENRIKDEAEIGVVRLKFVRKDTFDLSYFRHTGKWEFIEADLSMEECKEMIEEDPMFQPLF